MELKRRSKSLFFVRNRRSRESTMSTSSDPGIETRGTNFKPSHHKDGMDAASMCSDWSRELPPMLSTPEPDHPSRTLTELSGYELMKTRSYLLCPEDPDDLFSMDAVSMCSDWSRELPPMLSTPDPDHPSRILSSPTASYMSMESDATSRPSELDGESPSCPPDAAAGDVACSFCEERKFKACKSCLTCMKSFCQQHVADHNSQEHHQLVEVQKDLDMYKENLLLKQLIWQLRQENVALKKEISSLRQTTTTPQLQLPEYICRERAPTPVNVTLDEETAHCALVFSHDRKQVRLSNRSSRSSSSRSSSSSSSSSQRFQSWQCVLGSEGFSSGRHYWQVQVNRKFTISVMKQSASRSGRFTFAPSEGYWCIFHYWLSFTALNEPVQRLSNSMVPQILGVCVDLEEKWVTFYNAETKGLIHTFMNMQLAPNEKVFPIFYTVETTDPLIIRSLR